MMDGSGVCARIGRAVLLLHMELTEGAHCIQLARGWAGGLEKAALTCLLPLQRRQKAGLGWADPSLQGLPK